MHDPQTQPQRREAQEGERDRHDHDVGVQVGEQEAPQRELVDGVADHARRRPEVVEVDEPVRWPPRRRQPQEFHRPREVADQDEACGQRAGLPAIGDRRAHGECPRGGQPGHQGDAEIEQQRRIEVQRLP